MNDIRVVEDFFPTIIFKEIIHKVDSAPAKWSFRHKNPTYLDEFITYKFKSIDPNIIEDLGFLQFKFYGPGVESPDLEMEELFKKYISNKLGEPVKEILRINCNISTPYYLAERNQYSIPHIDVNTEHKSLVFYLHDSDGDTVFFDRFSDCINENIKDLSIVKRITPKKNSCVSFNGLRYHAAAPSKNQLRKIININYI